jgi:drug/metabolite transporter (DMT)-like permease
VACVLSAAFMWASGSLYAKRYPAAPSPFRAGGMQMVAGRAVLLAAGLLRGEASEFRLPAVTLKSWLAFAYLVTFGSLVAFTAYN